jgi:hypothetical protein
MFSLAPGFPHPKGPATEGAEKGLKSVTDKQLPAANTDTVQPSLADYVFSGAGDFLLIAVSKQQSRAGCPGWQGLGLALWGRQPWRPHSGLKG